MAGHRKSLLSADNSNWPENLRRKYRALGIPAVVAAVSADKRKAAAKPRKPRASNHVQRVANDNNER